MAQTMQSISPVFVETAKVQYAASSLISAHPEEPKTEDTVKRMKSLCDSANALYITLEKLYHVTKMTNIKLRVKNEYGENASPQAEPFDSHRR